MSFFNQETFITLLCLERKRSERSGHPFGLGIIDVSRLENPLLLCDALCANARETDIPGWYLNPSVLGVIFTTLNGAPIPVVRKTLMARMDKALRAALPVEDRKKAHVSLRIFPEEITPDLYPDSPNTKGQATFFFMKRVIDIVGSLTALIVFAPVFLAVSLLIKFTSQGPVFFRQKRLGKFGVPFDFFKFRTMYANNDPSIHREYVEKLIQGKLATSPVYKISNDPRVTPLGHFLRKSSLDELPQFINVLKGEMSLVGPRPPIPYEMDKYHIWHRRRVIEVKPGLTGLWQVYGRSRTTFDEMVRLDIRYINEQSLLLDLKLIIQTPFVMFTGAY